MSENSIVEIKAQGWEKNDRKGKRKISVNENENKIKIKFTLNEQKEELLC